MQEATHSLEPGQQLDVSSARPWVFVSYRRQDSQGTTGRLSDGLEKAFGKDALFRDVGAIHPGMNFVSEIELALAASEVVLAVIGPNWLLRVQTFGDLPADGPVDYLRWELKTALTRGVFTVPVLVDGASMPSEKDLPDDLRALALLQAHELRDKDWEYDLSRLIELIRPHLRPAPAPIAEAPKPSGSRWLVGSALVALLALVGAGVFYSGDSVAPSDLIDGGLPISIGDLIAEHSTDGGTVVLLGALLLILGKGLLAKYNDALSGRFGDLLKDGHAFSVATAALLVGTLMLSVGRTLFAATIAFLAVADLAVRRWAPRWLASPRRIGATAAAAVMVLAGALLADIAIDRQRQAAFDVAFLLPPEGVSDISVAERVFGEVNHALRVGLKDAPNVEIVPERLRKADYERFTLLNSKVLLAEKGRKGYARIFIQVKYNLDASSGVKRIIVSPYMRPSGAATSLRPQAAWKHEAVAGPTGSPLVALRASFELISFLSNNGLLRLREDELQQVRANLLDEFRDDLALEIPPCPAAPEVLGEVAAKRGALTDVDLRRVFAACDAANELTAASPSSSAAPTNRAVATIIAPYAAIARNP